MTLANLAATSGVMLFPLVLVYAGVMDLMTMTIRNVLVLALAAGWLLLAPIAGFTLQQMGASFAVALVVFALSFFCFARGWIGGGDAKLASVTALWFQPDQALAYLLCASLLGGVMTVMLVMFRSHMLPATLAGVDWIAKLHAPKAGVPYGAAMAPAALIMFPQTAWVAHAVG
jgi:prepilin peptidase CpaA